MLDAADHLAAAESKLPAVLRWSIADAWAWFVHGWRAFIHVPYLGVVALVLLAVIVLRGIAKILR
jgi:hypothetical protein